MKSFILSGQQLISLAAVVTWGYKPRIPEEYRAVIAAGFDRELVSTQALRAIIENSTCPIAIKYARDALQKTTQMP